MSLVCPSRQEMAFPLDFYLENFSAPSNKVTFTWPSDSFEIDPLYLAAISSLYRSIPHCNIFEINQRLTITTDDAALCFFSILPLIDGWGATGRPFPLGNEAMRYLAYIGDDEDGGWSVNKLYQATELCNFLGIKASAIKILRRVITNPSVKTIVPYHQMFLKTDCEEGITICEELIRKIYSPDPLEGNISEDNRTLRHYRCIIQAYIDFARKAQDIPANTKNFMKEKLGWKDEDERYGVQINLNGIQ